MSSESSADTALVLLAGQVEAVLRDHPEGLSEYQLMEQLDLRGVSQFGSTLFSSNLNMFQGHFLLFHILYRLRDRLGTAQGEGVEIHCLKICLTSSAPSSTQALATHDPLRDYYLDLDNLNQTDADQVEQMLDGFWHRYLAAEDHGEALACLGLTAPVSFDEVKSTYRRLVMEHHPDRGGDTAQLQQINEAMAVLERYYQS